MSNSVSPELWFISPPDTSPGFLFIATHSVNELDRITKLMIDHEFRYAATLSDEKSRCHVKNDCGLVYCEATNSDNLTFIGGSIIPYLSKRRLVGLIAIPTLATGIILVTIIGFLCFVIIASSLAYTLGNLELAFLIGGSYQLLVTIASIVVVPFLVFAIPLYLIQRRYSKVLRELRSEVKTILSSVFVDHEIHEVERNQKPMPQEIPKLLSDLIEQISDSFSETTFDHISVHDLPK
ncbi:MAG: hypothetical protein ACFFDV_03085 [Candidatus Thorarchaeota archaeon]